VAQETSSTSLGSLFLSVRGRFGALCFLVSVILGVLGLLCAFSLFAPPCCLLLLLLCYVDYWHPQPTQLAAVVLGAGILVFCQWVGDGEGEGAYLVGYLLGQHH